MCLSRTGSSQEAIAPHSQVSTCHRWCLSRCHQGATEPAPRGPICCTRSCYQGGQGEEGRSRERQEGREGEACIRRSEGTDRQSDKQAGSKGCAKEGPGYDSLRSRNGLLFLEVWVIHGLAYGLAVLRL